MRRLPVAKILNFILLVFGAQISNAQSNFFRHYSSNFHTRIHASVQLTNGDYILVGDQSVNNSYVGMRSMIQYIHSNGDTGYSVLSSDTIQSHFSQFSEVIHIDSGSGDLIVMGFLDSITFTDLFRRIVFHRITVSPFSIINTNTYGIPKNIAIAPINAALINDSIIILSCYKKDFNNGEQAQFCLSKYTINGDSLGSFYSTGPQYHMASNLLICDSLNRIKLNYLGLPLDTGSSGIFIGNFDEDLNLISSNKLCPFDVQPSIAKLTDTSYLFTSNFNGNINIPKQHIRTCLVNYCDSIISEREYYNHPDTILYASGGISTVVNDNHIFVTGIYNMVPGGLLWQQEPSWIQITKLDFDLNIISHHFYGGDAFYVPMGTIATSDGGCLVTGYRYDYNLPGDPIYNSFALKVNSLGSITGIDQPSDSVNTTVLLYPNPAQEYINIFIGYQHASAVLEVFDGDGDLVLQQSIGKGLNHISLVNLPSGMYFYNIKKMNQLIGYGTLVKVN